MAWFQVWKTWLVTVSEVGTLNGDLVSGVYLTGTVKNHHWGWYKGHHWCLHLLPTWHVGNLVGQRMHVERTSSLRLTGCNIELYTGTPRGLEMALEWTGPTLSKRIETFKCTLLLFWAIIKHVIIGPRALLHCWKSLGISQPARDVCLTSRIGCNKIATSETYIQRRLTPVVTT